MEPYAAADEAIRSPQSALEPASDADGPVGAVPATAEPPIVPPIVDFRRLDARVVRLWRTTQMIAAAIVLIVLAAAAVVVVMSGIVVGPIAWLSLFGAWVAVATIVVWLAWSYPRWAYDAWGYRIDAKVLETQSGVVFRVTRLLPLPRLQHVDLQRGPLERSFGIASLVLHTAGTHEATITIPGLDGDEAARLRDTLVKVGGDDAV